METSSSGNISTTWPKKKNRSAQLQQSEHRVRPTAEQSYYRIGTAKVLLWQNRIELPDKHFVQIRPKSFDVLVHLCQHSGKLVNKESLVQAIWNDVCVTDDSLVQCIVDIRKSLGPQNSKLLRTVTRRGYLITAEHVQQSIHAADTPAVLICPFHCVDRVPEQQLAGGLVDGIIARLLGNNAIKLLFQSSATQPQAHYQLTGNLQTQNGRTRITIKLLNLLSGQYIWAKTYENKTGDRFLLQDTLSLQIAEDLNTQIPPPGANHTELTA